MFASYRSRSSRPAIASWHSVMDLADAALDENIDPNENADDRV